MNHLVKVAGAILLSCIMTTTAIAATPFSANSRILSPPVWMPYDILIDNENIPAPTSQEMFDENKMGYVEAYAGGQKFTNLLDGYSIVIPSDMAVDMSVSDVCAAFQNGTKTLKVFKESFDTSSQRLSYLNYSNKFLENTTNHKLEKRESYTSQDREYYILEWSRNKLSQISNDKNFYACVDVCIGARVYTFFFTANKPFSQCGGYMDIVNSLVTFDPVIAESNAFNKGYKKADISRLNSSAKRTYNELFADDSPFKMGIFPPDKFGGFSKMEEFEQMLGYKFCAFLVYTEFTDKASSPNLQYISKVNNYMTAISKNFQYAQKSGKAIELTLQTPLTRNTGSNMIYEILNGEYEKFITEYARLIARYPDVTVLFRPFNEMNGDWCNYSAFHTSRDPQLYVELYKYIYNEFKRAGCNNVIWVWNPNERSFPNYKWNHQDLYYPGDEYVDVYGITGYNTGSYYEGETWRSFDEIYAPIYERALRINEKPIMITEFSCSANGGDKAAWIEDMFNTLPKYDKIKVGIWWHATDYDGENLSRPYFMDTPEGTMQVFDKYLN